jgi:TatA/E family protein of Tat protein translocase
MVMGLENPVHLIFIGIVALLVLGPRRLPELARALGHGLREFREAMSLESRDPGQGEVVQQPVAQQPVAQPAVVQPAAVPPPALKPSAAPSPTNGEAPPVDPAQSIRSADAPDRGPL